ncbi:MAG: hypothetical protein IH808_10415, partial [Proteobacteria bacterium]|nr:hypothetical protein [Pseudomonadota bacterium]
MLNACGSRSDDTGIFIQSDPDNDFLLPPNSHASLGVGDYKVVFENTSLPANPTPYALTVIYSDGTSASFSGNWTMPNQLIIRVIEVKRPGGIVILLNSGGATATLSLCSAGVPSLLCNAGAPTGVIASASSAVNPSIKLARYNIDQVAYAQAYYAAIDPLNERDTLAKWQAKNAFSSCDYEVRFRDLHDLGYGRHMCAWQNGDDIAVFVDNFQVTAVPGQNYGPLNLEAVVSDDRRWHIGTNAIEYSLGPSGVLPRFAKFYTFSPGGARRLVVDLDGQGAKAMPVPCISCHGGRAEPLLALPQTVVVGVTSTFPRIGAAERGDTLPHLQPINVDSLDFSSEFPYRRADQEAALKGINQLVLCTYPLVGAAMGAEDACRTPIVADEWQATTAAMIKAWYGGNGMPNATQSDSAYLPAGWALGAEENVYRTVVAPHCRVCHALRGNLNQGDIDFLTYAKFTGYADRIKHHVFDRGNMPLALLKYNEFWGSGSSAPVTLAAIVPGATDGSGNVLPPTRPVAIPGPDRVVLPGTTKLSAAE